MTFEVWRRTEGGRYGMYGGRHEFPVAPVAGDEITLIDEGDEPQWHTFLVERRQVNGYRSDLPSCPRVILYVREP